MRTDRHTDLTKIIVAFSNFANVPKKLKAMDNVMCIVISLLFSNTLAKSAESAVRVP
jgi:hypothetical protein